MKLLVLTNCDFASSYTESNDVRIPSSVRVVSKHKNYFKADQVSQSSTLHSYAESDLALWNGRAS